MSNKLPETIKKIRTNNNLTMQEFADALGYKSKTTIAKMESGTNDIAFDQLIKLIETYDADFGNFYEFKDLKYPLIDGCNICERIKQIKNKSNPYFVKELESGYVVLGDHQRFKGYTIFICKQHVTDLYQIPYLRRIKYLTELAIVEEAVHIAFNPDKINIESLGNGDAHLHFHIFPRYQNDTAIKGPVWWLDKEEMYNDKYRPSEEELKKLKKTLNKALDEVMKKRYLK